MSDEFRSLIAEAEKLALPLGANMPGEAEDARRWHERMAETFPITATGSLPNAQIAGTGISMKVKFSRRTVPAAIVALASRRASGHNRDPQRVADAIRTARTLLVRSLASNALMWVGHIASMRARGYEKQADHLDQRTPIGLRTDDWSDADAVCAAPWRYVGWDESFGAADILVEWVCIKDSDLGDFSLIDICDAVALSWSCEAALSDNINEAAALLVEVALATGSGHFHGGWESALDFALHETPEDIVKRVRSASARKAANAAHRENHAMRATVYQWCDENMSRHRSMDAAAEAIAGKLVPATFRTVRGWIGDWRKEQSARRP